MHLTIRKKNLIKQVLKKIKLIPKARTKINAKQKVKVKVKAKVKTKIHKYKKNLRVKEIKMDRKFLKDLSIQIIYKSLKNLIKYCFQKNKITAEKKIYQIKK